MTAPLRNNRWISPVRRGFPAVPFLAQAAGWVMAAFLVGCGGRGASSTSAGAPPTLQFLGAENADSEMFAASESRLDLGCSPRATFLLGPSETTPGLLDNWQLRPPGNCGSTAACGYLNLSFLGAEDEVLFEVNQASLAVVVDFSEDPLPISRVVASLVQGNSGQFYSNESAAAEPPPVQATWSLQITLSENCSSAADGTGGNGNESSGGQAMGGSEMGGAAASPGGQGGAPGGF